MQNMFSGLDDINPSNDQDPREDEDPREDDDNRSVDSEQADAAAKLGQLEEEDLTDDAVGGIMEITHDGKVTKEILRIGEGKR